MAGMKSALPGFDAEFCGIPHYIYAITNRIWEGRRVGDIGKYYADDCPVRSPSGLVVGAAAVIDATKLTMRQMPDRQLIGEDVVWKQCGGGFLSSHRIFSIASFAPAGGMPLRYRIIADCLVRENQIVEEWLVRDFAAIAGCLGTTAKDIARQQLEKGEKEYFTPQQDAPSYYCPELPDDEDARAYMRMHKSLWGGDASLIAGLYHPAAVLFAPGNREYFGADAIAGFHRGYAGAFDNASFAVCDMTACESERGKTIAMRWQLTGRHNNKGAFANDETTGAKVNKGAPVYVMGISHAQFSHGKIIREWQLADEVAIWKQILAGY